MSLICLWTCLLLRSFFFFFNDTATTEIYTLSLHDALPISSISRRRVSATSTSRICASQWAGPSRAKRIRSEEHTSELQSRSDLVCRLLLEKKKKLLRPRLPELPQTSLTILTRIHARSRSVT